MFCCRRGEREIELTELFTDPDFNKVQRNQLKDLDFVIMTMYHDKFKGSAHRLCAVSCGEASGSGPQRGGEESVPLRGEREVCPCDLFFFNGGENAPFPGEDDVCVPSPRALTLTRSRS